MKVTSDTLFHFTKSLSKLKSILDIKFQLTYCHEEYFLTYQKHDSFYPMVSFCDIPLSLATEQIKKYGSYAIGMNKEWAEKNNLNPVVYVEMKSLLAKDIQSTLDSMGVWTETLKDNMTRISDEIKKITKDHIDRAIESLKSEDAKEKSESVKHLKDLGKKLERESILLQDYKALINNFRDITVSNTNLFRYIKNYRGELKRRGKIIPNYRFYDEREWRYVPQLGDARVQQYMNADQYAKYREGKNKKPFIENINLPFDCDDIKYLLVKSNRDIPILIKKIRTAKLGATPATIDILSTKIITVDQIRSDF